MNKRFDVNIAGYTLTVKTDRSAEHMARLGELLNERVREVQKSGATANYLNVVMLAAMKLADEVLELRGERDGVKKRLEQKSRDLLNAMDSALKERG
jgi:cell division protein ZapA (FtsZ GTPase activity inhibitor)